MKKMILKVSTAALLLTQIVLVGGVAAEAGNTTLPRVATTASTAAKTTVPVMTDNLSKYGLKKAMNLPVTLSSEGLSYTLHKIMIYDFNSPEVKKLQKLYGFQNGSDVIIVPKYFIWTKVTIKNNTSKMLKGSGADIHRLIPLTFQTGEITDPAWPMNLAQKINSKDALWTYRIKPGEQITSYLAYYYDKEIDYFVIRMLYGKNFVEKYVVPE
ncbi:hypothetical protein [Paenibacillus rhizophilus]|uniref:DUF4309 domain-containing protein n=1 Tax=Paenibacillus rhizophilus TaxID=1850366 RepID=A0A3N9P968_9BACL|nr:hypothetical protein [Paenibacillus rhizophilus]RQW12030.1 hypothetical protein EH198_10300 [Paenibacillus rhizophilus]